PQETWDRCACHPNFHLHTGAAWLGARSLGERVEVETPQGPFVADFLICGTASPRTSPRGPTATHQPPTCATTASPAFHYLGRDFELVEKVSGTTPWIGNIHVFAIASTMSFGPSGSSINAMTTAKLVDGLTRGLFKGDLERHWRSLLAYDVPQAELGASSK